MLLKVANNPSLSRQAALGVLDQAGDSDEIKSQFFSHCWIVWPEREKRAKNNGEGTGSSIMSATFAQAAD
jgi:hypothetical protein